MIERYDAFTGTNGTAWPTGWTTIGGTATIQANRGRLSATSGYNSSTAHTTGVDIADVRLTGTFRIGNLDEQYPAIGVRHNGAWNGGLVDDGIILYLGVLENEVDLQVVLGGAYDSSIGTAAAVTWVANTDYRFTIELVEDGATTVARAKVWPESAFNLEPADWMIDGVTSVAGRPTSGGVSVAMVSGAGSTCTLDVDNVIIQDLDDGRLRVLPVGDSTTAGPYNFPGGTGNATWRRYLFDAFESGDHPLQMVGQNWSDGVADGSGVLGTYAGLGTWDHDHLSRNSWTTDDVLAVVGDDAATYLPDVAVIYIGLNDLLNAETASDTAGKVGDIIDAIRGGRADTKIVLCQLAPATVLGSTVDTFNGLLASLATAETTETSPIELADCHTGFDTGWLYDDLHWDDDGDQFVAAAIGDALTVLLAEWETFADGTSGSTGATVTGLDNGTRYKFRVAAVNSVGQGDWSNVDEATPSDAPVDVVPVGAVSDARTAVGAVTATTAANPVASVAVVVAAVANVGGSSGVSPAATVAVTVSAVAVVTATTQVTPVGAVASPRSAVADVGGVSAVNAAPAFAVTVSAVAVVTATTAVNPVGAVAAARSAVADVIGGLAIIPVGAAAATVAGTATVTGAATVNPRAAIVAPRSAVAAITASATVNPAAAIAVVVAAVASVYLTATIPSRARMRTVAAEPRMRTVPGRARILAIPGGPT